LNRIFSAALEIQAVCRRRKWRFCFIGGVAVQRWGEPRFTRDVDLTLLTGFGEEKAFIHALFEHFAARTSDAEKLALSRRVLLIRSSQGVEIDVGLGGLPYEERVIKRATAFDIGSTNTLTTCSAEDLVILKTFAGRLRDWADIAEIAARQAGKLDTRLIHRELKPLLELKEDSEAGKRLRKLLSKRPTVAPPAR
jgi:hypothetical protein